MNVKWHIFLCWCGQSLFHSFCDTFRLVWHFFCVVTKHNRFCYGLRVVCQLCQVLRHLHFHKSTSLCEQSFAHATEIIDVVEGDKKFVWVRERKKYELESLPTITTTNMWCKRKLPISLFDILRPKRRSKKSCEREKKKTENDWIRKKKQK